MRIANNLVGNKYGKLTVVDISYKDSSGIYYLCECDCGNKKIVRGYNLTREGRGTKSCGCLRKVKGQKRKPRHITHNMTNTRLYTIWRTMKKRCSDKYENKHIYYDRGIKYCEEWERFEPFMKWALANGYTDTLTLDRIDNDKGYSPDNCRWATIKEQMNNKRNNVRYTINGETKTMSQWCEYFGVPYSVVAYRRKKGKPINELFLPQGK